MAKRIDCKLLAQKINGLNRNLTYSSVELREKFSLSTNYFYPILNNFFEPQGKGSYKVKGSEPIYYKNVERVVLEVRKSVNKVLTPSEQKTKIDEAVKILHEAGYIILKVV